MADYRASTPRRKDTSGEHGIQPLLDSWTSCGASGAEESTTETRTEMWSSNHDKLDILTGLLTEKEIAPMLFLAERLLTGRKTYGAMQVWPNGPKLILDAAEEAADLFQYLLWFLNKMQEETETAMEAAGRE